MLTREQNELLTRTDRGTAAGDLLRRYWQPVALSEELAEHAPPLPVRILGEDLVLFRDERGRPGLLGRHCAHRQADLSYGRIEDGGLRCLYHGWLYDVAGNCLEQPGEPEGSRFNSKVHQPAYACRESGGMIFAFLGPGEPPLLPAYEFLIAPEEQRFVTKALHECNYLQGNEGNIDPVHISFLHRFLSEAEAPRRVRQTVTGTALTPNSLYKSDVSPVLEVERTDFGVRIFSVRALSDERTYVRISNFIMPNLSAFPGMTGGDGYSVNWHVPIDDTHHWKYMISFRRSAPLDRELLRQQYAANLTPDHRFVRNSSNRYLQDRGELTAKTFSGMGYFFAAHDAFAVEGEGPIQDRTQERLGSTDRSITMARQMLLRAIQDVQDGRDPAHVVRAADANDLRHITVVSEVIPASIDWHTYWQRDLHLGEQVLEPEVGEPAD